MPGRSFSSPSYRFGFNGMEKDDEVKGSGNSLDFGARIYDSRLGRWLSRDKVVKSYISPYQFGKNNPLVFIDPDGNDEYHFIEIYAVDVDGVNASKYPSSYKLVVVKKDGDDVFFTHTKVSFNIMNGESFEKVFTTEFFPNNLSSRSGITTTSYGFSFLNKSDKDGLSLGKLAFKYGAFDLFMDAGYEENLKSAVTSMFLDQVRGYQKNVLDLLILGSVGVSAYNSYQIRTLSKFSSGGSKLVSTSMLESAETQYGAGSTIGNPAGTFIAPSAEIDLLLSRGLTRAEIAVELGITDPLFLEGSLVRVDIAATELSTFNLRLSTGTEAGANSAYVSGANATTGGITEAIVDGISASNKGVTLKTVSP